MPTLVAVLPLVALLYVTPALADAVSAVHVGHPARLAGATQAVSPTSATSPIIDLWYGTTQSFGQLGNILAVIARTIDAEQLGTAFSVDTCLRQRIVGPDSQRRCDPSRLARA